MARLVKCNNCLDLVKVNGVGSSRNPLQRFLTGAFQALLPYTSSFFKEFADIHDMAVHRGCPPDIHFIVWFKSVDGEFYSLSRYKASKHKNWFARKYYGKQAESLREALEFNNGKGYDRTDCVTRKQIKERGL